MHSRQLIIALVAAAGLFAGLNWLAAAPGLGPRNAASGPRNDAPRSATIQDHAEPNRLAIVWTSGDPDVAHRMTLMYANGAKKQGWFDEVRLVIWGPSQRLVVADKDIRAYIERLIEAGVIVQACLACADSYGIADDLRAISGVEVKYMGQSLSDFLKSDEWHVITF
jgi:hypothetical protein